MIKKIVAAVAAILICVSASAQLNVKQSREATKTIATLRTGTVRLCASEGAVYFTLPSTNKFDHAQPFFLGKDAASAIETLDDLVQFLDEGDAGASLEVDNAGKTCTVRIEKQMGVRVLYFDFPGNAGLCSTSKGELEKMKAALVKVK